MKMSAKFAGAAIAASLALALLPALPAAAGVSTVGCTNGGSMTGVSNTTTVRSVNEVNCGTVYVRARYGTPGGNAFTNYTSSATITTQSGLPNVNRGDHYAQRRALFYTTP